jgi:uncharacterized membrane protein YbaN (DUF454 family)
MTELTVTARGNPPVPSRRRLVRWLLIAAGSVLVVIGVAGIFLPILPSVEFFLLAGICFARSSPAAHRWLTTNRLFGNRLRDYQEGRGATLATKLVTFAMLLGSVSATILLFDSPAWANVLLALVVIGITLHLATLRTIRR